MTDAYAEGSCCKWDKYTIATARMMGMAKQDLNNTKQLYGMLLTIYFHSL